MKWDNNGFTGLEEICLRKLEKVLHEAFKQMPTLDLVETNRKYLQIFHILSITPSPIPLPKQEP